MKDALISSDSVGFTLDEILFGLGQDQEKHFKQEPKGVFLRLRNELRDRSAILKLATSTATREAVLTAYKQDVGLYPEVLSQFEGFVRQCIRTGIDLKMKELASEAKDGFAKITWEIVSEALPLIGQQPVVSLNHERAAKSPAAMLHELQQEIENGINLMVRRIEFYLNKMVEMDRVGIMEWLKEEGGEQVCRYHYFQHFTAQNVKEDLKFDVELGKGWMEKKQKTVTTYVTFKQRNVHTLVQAKRQPVGEMKKQMMPECVRQLVANAPSWIAPHLTVITGDMTQSERVIVDDLEQTRTEVVSLYRWDPAIALGNYALAGWTTNDIDSYTPPVNTKKVVMWIMIGLAIVAGIWFGGSALNDSINNGQHEAYTSFLANKPAVKVANVHDQYQQWMLGHQWATPVEANSGFVMVFDSTMSYRVEVGDPMVLPWEFRDTRVLFGGWGSNGQVGFIKILDPTGTFKQMIGNRGDLEHSWIDDTYYGTVVMPGPVLDKDETVHCTLEILQTGGHKPGEKEWMIYQIGR